MSIGDYRVPSCWCTAARHRASRVMDGWAPAWPPGRRRRTLRRVDKQAVHDEMERARVTFHELLDQASRADLRRPSAGTRWTNEQLLFHMLLGYLIIRALLALVGGFSRLPDGASRRYARLLDAGTAPFDAVNYAGSWLGGSVLGRRQMAALFDRVTATLHRRLDAESDADLARGMHYPTGGTRSSRTS